MIGKIGIALTAADSNRVYALVENENGGLLVSDDAGATWKMINTGRNIRQRAFYYTHVFADHQNKDIVYALNTSAFRSTDGGKTFANIGNGTHGDHHDIWIDPDDPKHVVLGNDGGGTVTFNVDAGRNRSWSDQDFPTEQFYHVITTKHVPYHLCGAQQDNSTMCVPSTNGLVGRGGQRQVEPFYPVGGNEDGYIAPDPKDTDVFFSGSNNGSFITRMNRRTGELREVNPYPRFFSGENSASVVERWQWTFPIIFSPVDPQRALHLVAARLEDDQSGTDVGEDQRRSHASRSKDDAGFGRADHARHEQPGNLRDGVRARARQDRRQHHLGGLRRRSDSSDA